MRPAFENTAFADAAPVLEEVLDSASAAVIWRRLTVAVTVVPGNVIVAPSPLAPSAGVVPGASLVKPATAADDAHPFISASVGASSSVALGLRADVQLDPK